jgi:hypothetical protein
VTYPCRPVTEAVHLNVHNGPVMSLATSLSSDPPAVDYVLAAELAKSNTFLPGSYVTTMTGPSG